MNNETSTLDSIIEEVRSELRSMLIKRQKLIQRLGFGFERVVANHESICEEIKTALKDEIAEKAISSRDIERYCPDKWKKKTKPQKNDGHGQLPEDLVRYELQHINNDSYDIEFSLPFNDVQSYASSTFKLNGGINNLWFNCVIDKKTGKVLSAGVGRLDSCSELDSRGASIARDE